MIDGIKTAGVESVVSLTKPETKIITLTEPEYLQISEEEFNEMLRDGNLIRIMYADKTIDFKLVPGTDKVERSVMTATGRIQLPPYYMKPIGMTRAERLTLITTEIPTPTPAPVAPTIAPAPPPEPTPAPPPEPIEKPKIDWKPLTTIGIIILVLVALYFLFTQMKLVKPFKFITA